MKILLIGLGSIGTRHLRNIINLGYKDVSIVSRSGVLPGEFSDLHVFSTIEKAIEHTAYDAAILCNPTAQHITTLQAVINAGIQNVYLEKPVGHSFNEVEQFLGNHQLKANIFVGYDLHFEPGFIQVKELLSNNAIGRPISINAFVGQYLPDWRPHEDYSKGMSAKKETGGGVMLDLVHEFDYLYSFCGGVKTISAFYTNSGVLQIETEDVAEVLLQFESGCLGTIHLDYLQQKLIRYCIITGASGTIKWDIAERQVTWVDMNKEENSFSYNHFERNDRFVAIMKAFLENQKDDRLTSFSQGIESLKMVEAAKRSAETNQFISLANFNSSYQ